MRNRERNTLAYSSAELILYEESVMEAPELDEARKSKYQKKIFSKFWKKKIFAPKNKSSPQWFWAS